jgi:hypothetical protein
MGEAQARAEFGVLFELPEAELDAIEDFLARQRQREHQARLQSPIMTSSSVGHRSPPQRPDSAAAAQLSAEQLQELLLPRAALARAEVDAALRVGPPQIIYLSAVSASPASGAVVVGPNLGGGCSVDPDLEIAHTRATPDADAPDGAPSSSARRGGSLLVRSRETNGVVANTRWSSAARTPRGNLRMVTVPAGNHEKDARKKHTHKLRAASDECNQQGAHDDTAAAPQEQFVASRLPPGFVSQLRSARTALALCDGDRAYTRSHLETAATEASGGGGGAGAPSTFLTSNFVLKGLQKHPLLEHRRQATALVRELRSPDSALRHSLLLESPTRPPRVFDSDGDARTPTPPLAFSPRPPSSGRSVMRPDLVATPPGLLRLPNSMTERAAGPHQGAGESGRGRVATPLPETPRQLAREVHASDPLPVIIAALAQIAQSLRIAVPPSYSLAASGALVAAPAQSLSTPPPAFFESSRWREIAFYQRQAERATATGGSSHSANYHPLMKLATDHQPRPPRAVSPAARLRITTPETTASIAATATAEMESFYHGRDQHRREEIARLLTAIETDATVNAEALECALAAVENLHRAIDPDWNPPADAAEVSNVFPALSAVPANSPSLARLRRMLADFWTTSTTTTVGVATEGGRRLELSPFVRASRPHTSSSSTAIPVLASPSSALPPRPPSVSAAAASPRRAAPRVVKAVT